MILRSIILWALCSSTVSCFSQRYLTEVFPQLDSVIAAVYGNAVNYQAVNEDLLFDFYAPTADTAQKRPLIIYIHGGGFTSGSRSYNSVKLLCRKMAMKGYAVANIDYRLDPNFELYNSNTDRRAMTDAMHDAKKAIRFFKANAAIYKLDTNSFFIGGESAGAATAMMASYIDKQSEMSTYPKANPNNPFGSGNSAAYGNDVKATMCLCGLLLDTNAMENANNPPLLWAHGSDDVLVPISLAFNVVLRAANIGLPIQTKLFQGANHCPWYYGSPNWDKYMDTIITEITTFLYPQVASKTDIKQLENLSATVFPNPSNGVIHIQCNKVYHKLSITVINSLGKEVMRLDKTKVDNFSINLPENGLYYIKITDNHQMVLVKKVWVNQ